MTSLDVADLVVIAGRVLAIEPAAALEQADTQAAETALAEAPAPLALPDSYAAAAACARLMHSLLRHPPFPGHRDRVAVAAGLQFLAVNGWQACLDPPQVAAIVLQCLASGRIEPDDMAGWLAARLSAPAARRIRMPHITTGEGIVRAPLHGRARRERRNVALRAVLAQPVYDRIGRHHRAGHRAEIGPPGSPIAKQHQSGGTAWPGSPTTTTPRQRSKRSVRSRATGSGPGVRRYDATSTRCPG